MDGAVTVIYNPEEQDYKNILSYFDEVDYVCIIDNSSQAHLDEIKQVIDHDFEKIYYEHHPENIGLCKGMNYGINMLYEKGCTWALTMDFDSCFKGDAVKTYQSFVSEHDCSKVAILAPVYTFDRHQAQTYNGTRIVKRAMMSGDYINIHIFKDLGGFTEELFIDGLDNEYCIRLKKAGYKVLECGNALLEHKPSKTGRRVCFGKTIVFGYDTPQRYYGHARSLVFIIMRHRTIYETMFYIYKLLKIVFLFDNKVEYIRLYMKGTKDGYRIEQICRRP